MSRRIVPLVVLAILSCKPDFGERESFVDRVMVLAVRADPPEAEPGSTITTTILVATPNGTVSAPPASWSFCASPKRLTENGSVSAACTRDGVTPIGDTAGGVSAVIPQDACFLFGPETQAAELRPRDPDVTGGFYQPIRAIVSTTGQGPVVAFGFARIACNLANAPAEAAQRFKNEYRHNMNPTLLALEARAASNGAPLSFDALPRGASVVLRASWRPEDAETYLAFDAATQTIVTRRESLRVSWFTTAGSFESDRSGRSETELATFAENVWTAPEDARPIHLWAVLRDARGGTAFTSVAASTR